MCVQKVAGASPDRWGHGAPTDRSKVEGATCLFLCRALKMRPADCASRRRGAGRSRRTSYWSGSSARRAGLEEARLVNLARQSSVFSLLWQAIPDMIRQASAWLLGDVADTEKSSSVAGVLVLNCFLVASRQVCQPSSLFPILSDGDVEQHHSELLESFVFQLNTCCTTHGRVCFQ